MSQTDVNVAAGDSVKSLRHVYATVLDEAIASQKRGASFMQSIVERGVDELKTQTDTARDIWESMTQNTQKQRVTFDSLARQSVDAYMDYLHSVVSFYARGLEAIRQATE